METHQVTLTAEMPADSNLLGIIHQRKWLKNEPSWAVVFTDVIEAMAADKELNLTDLRVFLGLLKHMNFDNVVDISQQFLGERLNIPTSEVSKSLKKLIFKGYLEIFAQRAKQNIYRVNPYAVFKGRGNNLQELKQEFAPLKCL